MKGSEPSLVTPSCELGRLILLYPCSIHAFRCSSTVRSSGTCRGAMITNLVPLEYSSIFFTTSSVECFFTSSPLTGEMVCPMRAKSNRRYSYISVDVPTVLRGLRAITFCSMAMAGGILRMKSHSGLFMRPRNCRA